MKNLILIIGIINVILTSVALYKIENNSCEVVITYDDEQQQYNNIQK